MKKVRGCGSWARYFLPLVLALGALSWAGAQDQPTSPPPQPSTTDSSQPTMPSWDSLEQASAELSSKAAELPNLAEDSRTQSEDLKAQAVKLQSLLTDSTTLLARSLDMRKQEAQAAQVAIKSSLNRSDWWQRFALVAGGALTGSLIDKAPGALYGAGAGALVDLVLEVSGLFRIKF